MNRGTNPVPSGGEPLTADNSAVLLIDYQAVPMVCVRSVPRAEMKRNVRVLARAALVLKMPVVLTSSMEHAQGPVLNDLEELLPNAYSSRVRRTGAVNCMEDANCAAAVKKTGRRNLIMAGVTNDVSTIFAAISAVREGFGVHVVADAGGSPSQLSDEVALRRMEKAGATVTTTNQVIAELARDWTTTAGEQLIQILSDEIFSKFYLPKR